MTDFTDKELLSIFKDKDRQHYGFNLIVRKYSERLYWHIRKLVISHDDTDDILQNTFLKAWNALGDFRQESQLYTWLYRIATNESLTFLSSKRRKFFLPLIDVEQKLANTLESDEYFSGDELQKKLHKAVLTLPEKQRVVFNLKYFEEMTYEDMEEVLGTSVGALKASYHHAVKKIEKYIEAN
jgi:RNA polymerase sigma factor (sigma-70 family)